MKPTQKMVQEKTAEVGRSADYLTTLVQQMGGVLRCSLCEGPLDFSADSEVRRCHRFHCFHAACLLRRPPHGGASPGQGSGGCPRCPSGGCETRALGTPAERLR